MLKIDRNKHFTLTVANQITLMRFFLVFPLIFCIVTGRFLYAEILFVIAMITDCADGMVARIRNECTREGALLDAATDKFLIISVFLAFFYTHAQWFPIPLWVYLSLFCKELIQIAGGALMFFYGWTDEIKARLWGKVTMFLYSVTIFFLLLYPFFECIRYYITFMYTMCALIGLFALLDYGKIYYRLVFRKDI